MRVHVTVQVQGRAQSFEKPVDGGQGAVDVIVAGAAGTGRVSEQDVDAAAAPGRPFHAARTAAGLIVRPLVRAARVAAATAEAADAQAGDLDDAAVGVPCADGPGPSVVAARAQPPGAG